MDTILKTTPTALPSGWRARRRHPLRRAIWGVVNLMMIWQRRAEDREILRSMNDARLKDIGISRAEIAREADKPFWRA